MNIIGLAKRLSTMISQGKGKHQIALFQNIVEAGSQLVTEAIEREGSDVLEFYSKTEPFNPDALKWQRRNGYECSTKGDVRFSPFNALMPDGRSIEMWYQCDLKGYDIGGTNWKLGKGNPPIFPYPHDQLWEMYLNLWRVWAIHNSELLFELVELAKTKDNFLSDCFASTPINQARALTTIINDWIISAE